MLVELNYRDQNTPAQRCSDGMVECHRLRPELRDQNRLNEKVTKDRCKLGVDTGDKRRF